MMITVVVALTGCVWMALHNTGYQANLAVAAGAAPLATWQTGVMQALGLEFAPDDLVSCLVHGGLYYLPILLVTFAVGGLWELLFAVVRKHELNEGFLVTGMLFPLVLPPTIPLWQVALGISFGIVVGKEIFGGTGMNVLNPALVSRAFVFFAYPAAMSGDAVWIAADTSTDAVSGATALAVATLGGTADMAADFDWGRALVGFVPGSMGETSVLACLAGAALLIGTGVGSWRIMLSVAAGTLAMAAGTERHRVGDESLLRRESGLAPGDRRLGLRYRLHGDRPGVGPRGARRALRLRLSHRRARRAHPRRQPGLS